MGTLTDRQIKNIIASGDLVIDPFDEKLIQPATLDLRAHHKLLASPLGENHLGRVIDLRDEINGYQIMPGQMVAILSFEYLELPFNISGRFGIRSFFARKGLNAFGGIQIDPGFKGRLSLNLLNVGPEPIAIKYQEPIFSIEINRLDEMVEKPYNGIYQNQNDFPADQHNYILNARTTSLAEIPTLRKEVSRLNGLLEEFGERMPDPDDGLQLHPQIEETLSKCKDIPKDMRLNSQQMKEKLGL